MECKQISDLLTPCLLIDKNRLIHNIERMAQKAKENGVILRPHIKTHKCIEIAELQRDYGASGLTVSTLDEAAIFADEGFNDITYAVPISSNKVGAALAIADNTNLKLLVDSHHAIDSLNEMSKQLGTISEVLLKVDCGYHRCGIDPSNPASIKLVQKIVNSSHLRFQGILTHAGHSYIATTIEEVKEIALHEQQVMVRFAKDLENENVSLKPDVVSIGSTPTISLTNTIMDGITEIRPGNYVFYDYSQFKLGTCKLEDCSLTALARVIGKYEDHLVIDAGATALSKDLGPSEQEIEREYGKIYAEYQNSTFDQSLTLLGLSQEHGKVNLIEQSTKNIDSIVRILPNHSCLTANLHDYYYIVEDSRIIDQWQIRRDRPITSACLL